jgi:glycosyltransferase involved in cell wall biosynthesis
MGGGLMRRLLLICYYFPPTGGPGAQRPAKFARYLPEFGWDVCVLAPELHTVHGKWAPEDPSLNGNTTVVRLERVAHAGASLWRPHVDPHQGWAWGSWKRAKDLLTAECFDAVLITMSPFSLAHVGLALKREFNTPVVLDLRDPWVLDAWATYRCKLEWRRHRTFMRRSLAAADGVIANTPEALGSLKHEVPELGAEQWAVIPNGYDMQDLEGLSETYRDPNWLTVVHTGSLHSSELYPSPGLISRAKRCLRYRPESIRPEGRTLKYLLEALRRLRRRRHPDAECVRVRCVGVVDAATERSVRESGVADQVELMGYLHHRESIRALLSADVLFLPLHGYADGSPRSLTVPGKTYEYLASRRPILGALPPGDARDLVERSGAGFVADPCDVEEIACRISELLLLWRAKALPEGAADWLGCFERRRQTQQLAAFLDSMLPSTRIGRHAMTGATC